MLTDKPMNRVDAWRMIQRRAADLGMRIRIGCHTFRATGITTYLEAGGTLENAQLMAADDRAVRSHGFSRLRTLTVATDASAASSAISSSDGRTRS